MAIRCQSTPQPCVDYRRSSPTLRPTCSGTPRFTLIHQWRCDRRWHLPIRSNPLTRTCTVLNRITRLPMPWTLRDHLLRLNKQVRTRCILIRSLPLPYRQRQTMYQTPRKQTMQRHKHKQTRAHRMNNRTRKRQATSCVNRNSLSF